MRVIHNKKNLGKAGGLNKGIKAAKGELIAVVDTQSYLEKTSLSKLVGFFDNPKVGVATGKILVKNKNKLIGK